MHPQGRQPQPAQNSPHPPPSPLSYPLACDSVHHALSRKSRTIFRPKTNVAPDSRSGLKTSKFASKWILGHEGRRAGKSTTPGGGSRKACLFFERNSWTHFLDRADPSLVAV